MYHYTNHLDYDMPEEVPNTPSTPDSVRPPNLNLTCPGHGSLDGGLQEDGESVMGGFARIAMASDVLSNGVEDTMLQGPSYDSDDESINAPEDLNSPHEVGDLGIYTPADILAAFLNRCRCSCRCADCSCTFHFVRTATLSDGAFSLNASPSRSRSPTPFGSMIVGGGSGSMLSIASSVMSLDQHNWNSGDSIVFGTGFGALSVHNIPHGFLQQPLRLTATPTSERAEYPYPLMLEESDSEF